MLRGVGKQNHGIKKAGHKAPQKTSTFVSITAYYFMLASPHSVNLGIDFLQRHI